YTLAEGSRISLTVDTGCGAGSAAATGCAGADAAAVATAGCDFSAAGAAPWVCNSSTGVPIDTLSPIFSNSFCTVPACGQGTSMVALSDSSTTMVCSAVSVSPGLTAISMTSTPSAPPISGIDTVTTWDAAGADFSAAAAAGCVAGFSAGLSVGAAAGAEALGASATSAPPISMTATLSPCFTD